MKKKNRLTAVVLAALMGIGAFLPAAKADAADIQPLPFPTYVNGSQVVINNALLYGGHTYVQLRELAGVTNMGIEFVSEPSLEPGGGLPQGISIDQPTFVYVKDGVQDWGNVYGGGTFKGVDITTLHNRYMDHEGNLAYHFNGSDDLVVPDGEGGSKTIDLHIVNSYGKVYVSVDEFRDKIQPYLVDMCMQ